MTITAFRNAVLPIMALAVAAVVRLPNQLAPRIECSPNVHEGEKFYCSVELEYPPDLPEYSWERESGDCDSDVWNGQTIQLATPLPAKSGECRLHAIVRDTGAGQIAGPAEYSVIIQKLDIAAPAMTQKPLAAATPQPVITRPVRVTELQPQLLSFDPPDETLRAHADSAVVQGRAKGSNLGAYIVAFYTRTTAGWSLQEEAVAIDPTTGKWEIKARFGDGYAAVLARKRFNPEPSLRSLPRRGGDIVDVKTGR